jgi:tetratricopeptide (TPR) repeat protein
MPAGADRRMTTPLPFADALAHHQAGRFEDAEALYRGVLVEQPSHADALHLLGVLAHQTGRSEQAVSLIERAIAQRPEIARYHSNFGSVLQTLGRLADAEASCREALRLQPHFPEALCNLGIVLGQRGRDDEAEACTREALRLKPDYPEALNNLGNVLRRLGRMAEAEAQCRAAIRLRPDLAEAHGNLGNLLHDMDRLAEAAAHCREAIRLRPAYAEAYNGLGTVLARQGRWAEAEAAFRQALTLQPRLAEAHSNLGNLLRNLDRLDEAEAACRAALAYAPDLAAAHNNLGNAIQYRGRQGEAEACYRTALRLQPDYGDAQRNLAMLLLLDGRLAEGWTQYEGRLRAPSARRFSQPQWGGEEIGDRTILLHAEQGLGDTLQFCRYVPRLAGARVVLEVQRPLLGLLSDLAGSAELVAAGDPLPPFNLHCPLMSLPRAFGTALETIPAAVPYLSADPPRAEAWRDRLRPLAGIKVGLVWAGNPRLGAQEADAVDRRRSIALAMLAPLADLPGIRFVSLQKGEPGAQAKSPPACMVLHDWTDALKDFADTAALIENLDLVISVDTAVAHLAGALGKPVWLLNRFDTDWRWLLDRADSPWYPTMRVFRQPAPGDWESVLEAVRSELIEAAASPKAEPVPCALIGTGPVT